MLIQQKDTNVLSNIKYNNNCWRMMLEQWARVIWDNRSLSTNLDCILGSSVTFYTTITTLGLGNGINVDIKCSSVQQTKIALA